LFSEGKTKKRQEIKGMIKIGRKKATDSDSFQSIMAKDINVEVYEFNKGKRIGYKWTDKEGLQNYFSQKLF